MIASCKIFVSRVLPWVALMMLMSGCEGEDLGLPAPAVPGYDESGATKAVFTVSSKRQVHFSRANLQYRPSTQTWRFAEQPYDLKGQDNRLVSSDYDGWVDLFGWGTSGWASGAVAYRPTDTSVVPSDYLPGGSVTTSLTGSHAFADWGQYNMTSHSGLWRTLTAEEWHYLLELRTDGPNLRGAATIEGGHCGMVIAPDGWSRPNGIAFKAEFGSYSINSYTAEEWARLEESGMVFLPAAGYRRGTDVSGVGTEGHYWSASPYDAAGATNVSFTGADLGAVYGHNRHHGYSVRLVKE